MNTIASASPGRRERSWQPRVLDATAGALDHVVTQLRGLAHAVAPLWQEDLPSSDDLTAYRPLIHDLLAAESDLVAGAGVAIGPGRLTDQDRHLEWWFTRATGGAEALRVNLDPAAPDFYDFTAEEWFLATQERLEPVATGPLVDYACTIDYALTLTHPVFTGGEFVAVAAADIPLERLEPRLMPMLAEDGRRLVLANDSDRVVLSTTAAHRPGERLPKELRGRGVPLRRIPWGGWRLIDITEEDATGR